MKNDIMDAFSAFFLGAAGAVAAVAFLAAPGGHGIAGLVNWPVLTVSAVLGAVGAFLWGKQTRHIPGPARGTALDRLGGDLRPETKDQEDLHPSLRDNPRHGAGQGLPPPDRQGRDTHLHTGAGRRPVVKTCSVCGRQVKVTVACPYQRHGLETCPDCCVKCYHSEPFPCPEYESRNRERGDTLKDTKTGKAPRRRRKRR